VTSLELGFECEFVKDRNSSNFLKRLILKNNIAKRVFSYKPYDVKIDFDNDFSIETKLFNFSVVNSKISKGGELFQNDGKLTSFLIPYQSKLVLLNSISNIASGNYEELKGISKFRSKKIRINTFDKPQNVYADSSLVGTTPVEVMVSSKKVKVIVSRNRTFK
jgi:diacylglycerol kinase family enzyme